MAKLKPGVQVTTKKGLHYGVGSGGRLVRFRPWLGDLFSFSYDAIMANSVFPKKFGGEIHEHYAILSQALENAHGQRVLELATGSGSAVHFLSKDNAYTGTDISAGLLGQAAKRFEKAGFSQAEFYVASANDLPFAEDSFDLCLCILSLNFFGDAEMVWREVGRVLVAGGVFVGSVPVPERNKLQSTIRGTLHSEAELKAISQQQGFEFESMPCKNGALLYFRATKL